MGEITIRKALDDYRTVYMAYRNFAPRTRVEYQNDLEDLARYLQRAGIEHVGGLGLLIIERYVAQLEEKGISSLTRKRKVVTIRSFLLFLYHDSYIQTNVAAKIIVPFTETHTPHVLTQRECDQLRKACAGNPRDAAIIELLLQTGIRLSELTRLTLNDVDWVDGKDAGQSPGGFVRILGERGRKERVMPLSFPICVVLRKYLAVRNNTDTATLWTNRFANPLGERGVQKMLRKYLKNAGIGSASVHTLRHTFGTRLAGEGKRRKTIQDIMGDKDPRGVSVYYSLSRVASQEKPA